MTSATAGRSHRRRCRQPGTRTGGSVVHICTPPLVMVDISFVGVQCAACQLVPSVCQTLFLAPCARGRICCFGICSCKASFCARYFMPICSICLLLRGLPCAESDMLFSRRPEGATGGQTRPMTRCSAGRGAPPSF